MPGWLAHESFRVFRVAFRGSAACQNRVVSDVVRYRVSGGYRVAMLALFTFYAVLAVFLIAVAVYDGQPVGAVAAWAMAGTVPVGCLAYLYLFRVVYELEFDGERLRWRAPLRSGDVALADLTRVRAISPGAVGFLHRASGPRMRVYVRKGFTDFTGALVAARPGLAVRIGFGARLAERCPGRSAFRRLG